MIEATLAGEPTIRLACFAGVLLAMMAWEVLAPKRPLSQPRALRWTGNIGVVLAGTLLVRVVFPLGATAVAALAAERGIGLFNVAPVPFPLAVVLSVLILDLAVYGQHVASHHVPMFWRLHRMHHADLDFDTTTGVRFHPIEIALSLAVKMAMILATGAPAFGVFVFEVLLNATSLFNHGNVRMPSALDRALRRVVVTPDMHRVHHSVHAREHDSNFGFNLPWWDRLFGTYRDQPEAGHEKMTIGLPIFREPRELWLHRMLAQPFVGASPD
ncbi:MAG: sterol desaturase family protein [Rhodospirillales bacterium]|nr:sterol desaturase family protein [Rhodospirillales bacterium]